MDVVIGLCSFICGFLFMFAIHMIMIDVYQHRHEEYIKKIEGRNKLHIDVTENHTFAAPGDVSDLKFNE